MSNTSEYVARIAKANGWTIQGDSRGAFVSYAKGDREVVVSYHATGSIAWAEAWKVSTVRTPRIRDISGSSKRAQVRAALEGTHAVWALLEQVKS